MAGKVFICLDSVAAVSLCCCGKDSLWTYLRIFAGRVSCVAATAVVGVGFVTVYGSAKEEKTQFK